MEQDERDYDQEFKAFKKKLEQDLAQLNKDSKKRSRVWLAVMSLFILLILTSIVMIIFPATEVKALLVLGACSILVSFINFYQCIGAWKWSKRWALVLLAISLLNMVLGITKFI